MQKVIYLDYNATTPVDPRVLEVMIPYFSTHFGNPSGNSHSQSWMTAAAVKKSRSQVANLIHADPSEIIFTSGATESINLAIKGVLLKSSKTKLITSNIEHAAGHEIAKWTKNKGFKVQTLNVQKNGLIDLNQLEPELAKNNSDSIEKVDTILVSLILAHNEIGSLYNLEDLALLKSKYNFILHLDATQALLTEEINVHEYNIDLMSFSAHKIYGPKGVGALFLNKKTVGHQIEPLIIGGGQEFGLRSGTLNVPGIVGLGEACDVVQQNRTKDSHHYLHLSQFLLKLLSEKNIEFKLNGDSKQRIFHNISITLPEAFSSKDLMSELHGFCLSQGSACGSGKVGPNQTLKAIGLNESEMQRTLRIGLGRSTEQKDLELFVDRLSSIV